MQLRNGGWRMAVAFSGFTKKAMGRLFNSYEFDNLQIFYYECDLTARRNVSFLKVDIFIDFDKWMLALITPN